MHVILHSDLLDSGSAVETVPDGLIRLHELIELLSKVLVLPLQHSYVIFESLNLSLELLVSLVKVCPLESEGLCLLPEDLNEILSLSDLEV